MKSTPVHTYSLISFLGYLSGYLYCVVAVHWFLDILRGDSGTVPLAELLKHDLSVYPDADVC